MAVRRLKIIPLALVSIALIWAYSCGERSANRRSSQSQVNPGEFDIRDGVDASDKYPAIGKIILDDNLKCTGTLINIKESGGKKCGQVLTAAHCVVKDTNSPIEESNSFKNLKFLLEDGKSSQTFAQVGAPDFPLEEKDKTRVDSDVAIIHIDMSSDKTANRSILKLAKDQVPKIQEPYAKWKDLSDEILNKSRVEIVAYGTDQNDAGEMKQEFFNKKSGFMYVVRSFFHNSYARYIDGFDVIEVFSPDRFRDDPNNSYSTCPGDSGGPSLNSKSEITGIAAFYDSVDGTFCVRGTNPDLITHPDILKAFDQWDYYKLDNERFMWKRKVWRVISKQSMPAIEASCICDGKDLANISCTASKLPNDTILKKDKTRVEAPNWHWITSSEIKELNELLPRVEEGSLNFSEKDYFWTSDHTIDDKKWLAVNINSLRSAWLYPNSNICSAIVSAEYSNLNVVTLREWVDETIANATCSVPMPTPTPTLTTTTTTVSPSPSPSYAYSPAASLTPSVAQTPSITQTPTQDPTPTLTPATVLPKPSSTPPLPTIQPTQPPMPTPTQTSPNTVPMPSSTPSVTAEPSSTSSPQY